MNRTDQLRTQLDYISRRLNGLVVKLEGEQYSRQSIPQLSMNTNKSLLLQINLYQQNQTSSKNRQQEQIIQTYPTKSPITKLNIQSHTVDVTEYKQERFLEYSHNPKQIPQIQVNDNYKEDINPIIDTACQTDPIQQKNTALSQQQQSQLLIMTTENKNQRNTQFNTVQHKECLFDGSQRQFNFSEKFNLTLQPLSRILFADEKSHSKRDSFNYSRTSMKQTHSNMKQLNKQLNTIYTRQYASKISTINAAKQKTANTTPIKDIGLFGGLLSTGKSKSQSLLSKSATCHKKCIQEQLNKISCLSNSRQKNRDQRFGHYVQERPTTEQLIGQIRSYLDVMRKNKQYVSGMKDSNKSFMSYRYSKSNYYEHK